jgi:cytochrome c biogenesis factor
MKRQTKITYLLLAGAVVSSIMHNLIYGAFRFEEPFFFFFTLILVFAFVISILYNFYTYKTQGRPKDLWQLGWLGLLGLIGLLPRFGPGFYGLYGFFGFFGLKKK